PACFEALARINETGTAILVPRKTASRKLAVAIHPFLVIAFRSIQEFSVPRLQIEDSRLAKSLGDVHVVPIDDAARPIRHLLVNSFGEIKQPSFAGPIVEPINALDVVAKPDLWPIAVGKRVARLLIEPLEIFGHERKHSLVKAVLINCLEHIEYDQVLPEVKLPLERRPQSSRS